MAYFIYIRILILTNAHRRSINAFMFTVVLGMERVIRNFRLWWLWYPNFYLGRTATKHHIYDTFTTLASCKYDVSGAYTFYKTKNSLFHISMSRWLCVGTAAFLPLMRALLFVRLRVALFWFTLAEWALNASIWPGFLPAKLSIEDTVLLHYVPPFA